MRILVIADAKLAVPPSGYGGTERIVSVVCDGLAKRGHVVDLMAAPGSKNFGGKLVYHRSPSQSKIDRAFRKVLFQILSYRHSRSANVVVSFGRIDYLWAIGLRKKPLICVFQNPVNQAEINRVKSLSPRSRAVAISLDQIDGLVVDDTIDIIYNGVEVKKFQFVTNPDSPPFVVFLGRITANKGVHLAIKAAKIAGVKLVIAGNVSEKEAGAEEYFRLEVAPHLGDQVEYVGVLDDEAKAKLLGKASALLFPIQWKEPFGIVMAEALACGCPIIGWKNGSVPEVVRHGDTGFVVESVEEMVWAIENINSIDRALCRRDAELRFSASAVTEAYLQSIAKVING